MDVHADNLSMCCRVSGEKFSARSIGITYKVADYHEQLRTVFRVDVTKDDPSVQPKFFCHICKLVLDRCHGAASSSFSGGGCGAVRNWLPHSRTNCELCQPAKRGRKPKRKSHLNNKLAAWQKSPSLTPEQQTVQASLPNAAMLEHPRGINTTVTGVHSQATPSYKANRALEKERFIDNSVVECYLCKVLVDGAIYAPCCEVLFCSSCICEWLKTRDQCPECSSNMQATQLQEPNKGLRTIISRWIIHCDYHEPALAGCPVKTVPLCDLRQHVKTCAFNLATLHTPVRAITTASLVGDVLQASPSKMCGDVAERLMSTIALSKTNEGRLEIKSTSRGRQQVFQRITVASTSSQAASATIIRRRSSELQSLSQTVCGGPTGARAQEVAGIKRLSIAEKDKLLQDIGLHPTAPSPGTALANKADLALSFSKFRQLRIWLKSMGVELESERKMRAFIATQVPNYSVKTAPMMKRNGDLRMAAVVYFPDLVSVVMFFLDKLDSVHRLTWSNGIPESEVCIKIGGDHGGGTFKLSFQVSHQTSITLLVHISFS